MSKRLLEKYRETILLNKRTCFKQFKADLNYEWNNINNIERYPCIEIF